MTMTNDRAEVDGWKGIEPAKILPLLGCQPRVKDDRSHKSNEWVIDGVTHAAFKAASTGHWLYRPVAGGRSITVIDIALAAAGQNFGQMRKLMRGLTGQIAPSSPSASSDPSASSSPSSIPSSAPPDSAPEIDHDHLADLVEKDLSGWACGDLDWPQYLCESRMLHSCNLPSPRFADDVYSKGSRAAFVYRDQEGRPVGVEKKSSEEKRYTKGGRAGVWIGRHESEPVTQIIVCESPIDAFSLISPSDAGNMLIAVRSGAEMIAADVISREIAGHEDQVEIMFATDNDLAGIRYAEKIWSELAKRHGYSNLRARMHLAPSPARDWNDYHVKYSGAPDIDDGYPEIFAA